MYLMTNILFCLMHSYFTTFSGQFKKMESDKSKIAAIPIRNIFFRKKIGEIIYGLSNKNEVTIKRCKIQMFHLVCSVLDSIFL